MNVIISFNTIKGTKYIFLKKIKKKLFKYRKRIIVTTFISYITDLFHVIN